ncbi:hypothetical protein [Stygiolobus caldivivus]|uniref:Uncharacterized protein n=1 Tax=Stygiolobus caldivivus TaxID=2824673 RepID=A0A8D5U4Z4_9CREN|nr:hypothetical protein [Stygiolobus caldivivus]BCU69188.1 hypothetical protein KN1_04850 [Stygiolobus caldivivus]
MISLPIPLLGIPLKGVNNPILVAFGEFDSRVVKEGKTKLPSKFFELFEEATGFKCDISIGFDKYLPFSSSYIYLSDLFFRKSIEECDIPISENEIQETLSMIDDALFDSELIRALRAAFKLGVPVLYRDEEEPIRLSLSNFPSLYLFSYPLDLSSLRYVDNSLIHLVGMIPLDYVETKDTNLLGVENGLWTSLYGIPFVLRKDWKLIWDLNYVTAIEVRGV